jgi:hypothetical protein
MENDDAKNGQREIAKESPDGAPNIQANSGAKASKNAEKQTAKAKGKKWTLRRHWQRASSAKRVKWVLEGMGVLIALLILVNYVWQNLETRWNFKAEHRPKVILNKPPDLISTFECEVTDKAIHTHSGAMKISIKNIRKGDALSAFVAGPYYKLVPEKKTGFPEFDGLPSITDDTCKNAPPPKMKLFPVHGEEELGLNVTQSVGVFSLVKTNSVSVTFGGPQKEPEPSPGDKPSDVIHVTKDAQFQLYAPMCVYYADEDGVAYASCRTYRMVVESSATAGTYVFSCTQSPIRGRFEEAFSGYCEK